MLRPDRVRPGDVLVAMGSSGLHSNGYSLARHVLLEIARMPLDGHVEEFGRTLGEELLVPTRIYARDCLALVAETEVRTFAHITGGGLARNLERVLPAGLQAVVERDSWTPAPVFNLIASRGRVERAEMEKTFNMGVGMIAVLPADDVDRALAVLTARHVDAWVLGEVRRDRRAGRRAPRAHGCCCAASTPGSDPRVSRTSGRPHRRVDNWRAVDAAARNCLAGARCGGCASAGGRPRSRAIRLTGAAVAAFVVAELVGLDDPPPLIAALTALIVVQVTLTETLVNGLQRVASVVSGVLVALVFVNRGRAELVEPRAAGRGVDRGRAAAAAGSAAGRGADQRDAGARRGLPRRSRDGGRRPGAGDAGRHGGRARA